MSDKSAVRSLGGRSVPKVGSRLEWSKAACELQYSVRGYQCTHRASTSVSDSGRCCKQQSDKPLKSPRQSATAPCPRPPYSREVAVGGAPRASISRVSGTTTSSATSAARSRTSTRLTSPNLPQARLASGLSAISSTNAATAALAKAPTNTSRPRRRPRNPSRSPLNSQSAKQRSFAVQAQTSDQLRFTGLMTRLGR